MKPLVSDILFQIELRWKKELDPPKNRIRAWSVINREALIEDKHPSDYCYERAIRLGGSKSGIHDAIGRLGVS
ncbi:hypothetical protein, partial [Candidatus Cyrtobacter comes]|uniref:hypothetical protein n=1 Tax=Candidatus Cyrtobacter comes TaxID=675776 RepID=UPI002ACEAF28